LFASRRQSSAALAFSMHPLPPILGIAIVKIGAKTLQQRTILSKLMGPVKCSTLLQQG
jgi:hypothetical protein